MIDQSVADVTTRSVRTLPAETTASAVAKLFAEHDIGSAVVVDPGDGEILGIVTESDIMAQVAAGVDVTAVRVGSFVSTGVVTVESTESIHEAAARMRAHSIRRLPVVDDGELIGDLRFGGPTRSPPGTLPPARDRGLRFRGPTRSPPGKPPPAERI